MSLVTRVSFPGQLTSALARAGRAYMPERPARASWFIIGSFAVVALGFTVYLLVFEFNISQWHPWGVPYNLVAAGVTAVVFAALLHVLTRRIWFSLTFAMAIILLLAAWSEIKFKMNGYSLTVVDLFIIDPASIAFGLRQPDFFWHFLAVGVLALLAIVMFVAEPPGQVSLTRRLTRLLVSVCVFTGVILGSMTNGLQDALKVDKAYHITVFAKSAFAAGYFFQQSGVLEKLEPESDAPAPVTMQCTVPKGVTRPHVIMILDEASIDTTRLPRFAGDRALAPHFSSFDGAKRSMRVETFGGGTWLTELSVLTGLSTRNFGPFGAVAPRMIANRVHLALPEWLGQCGYDTRSIYPVDGRFVSARVMHDGLKVASFEDALDLKKKDPAFSMDLQLRDKVYYDLTVERIAAAPTKPSFTFLWLTGNHAPWDTQLSPDTHVAIPPAIANTEIGEYVRRQRLSQMDFNALKSDLEKRFPGQPFLLVRFGDHLPFIGGAMIDPQLSERERQRKIEAGDPAYFTTYLAFNTINYAPPGEAPKHDTLSAPYLGLALLKLMGLPANPAAQYQARIIDRCGGLFHECEGGEASRRFNGWLVRHGLVEGL